ncbi:MAG: glutamate--tRNA ligase [Nitrospirota bacterium]
MKTSDVRVRFAPSPTGFLHIGGARTALFNWLFARSKGGKFFLRIEDTDLSRSTEEAIDAIIDGLSWLGIHWDHWEEETTTHPTRQTARLKIYREKVFELLDRGRAYLCYCTPEELESRRKDALAEGRVPRYDGRCKNRTSPIPGRDPAIRFAAETTGTICIDDLVKGSVTFDASIMDDLIILRSDGTPTYNFCVVVDDVDMAITHVIRGDDHLNNTPRQVGLYQAMGYPIPAFGHLSMILGADKTRLSKRHGATAVQQYRDEGYLPEAMINYLVRLGWSYKDQEIFSLDELIEKFSLDQVGVSAAMFNPEKLKWINSHYIKSLPAKDMAVSVSPYLSQWGVTPDVIEKERLEKVIVSLQERSRTLVEMAESAACFFLEEILLDEKALAVLTKESLPILNAVLDCLFKDQDALWDHAFIKLALDEVGILLGLKLAQVAQPIRAAVTGKTVSPGIFDVLHILGREKTFKRINMQIERLTKSVA